MAELVLAFFIIGVGLSVAGMGTHLYQAFTRREAALRWDGQTVLDGLGNLCVSFVCGPYIMLHGALRPNQDGTVSATTMLLASVIALSWAFMTGLMLVGTYAGLRAI